MNTDFIRPAIAIVLTACGIETTNLVEEIFNTGSNCNSAYRLRY